MKKQGIPAILWSTIENVGNVGEGISGSNDQSMQRTTFHCYSEATKSQLTHFC